MKGNDQLITDSLDPSVWLPPATLDAEFFEHHSLLEEFQEFLLG